MTVKTRLFTICFFLSLIADQVTKIWARAALKPIYPDVKTVLPGYFDLRYSENPGIAFGMLRDIPGARYLLFLFGLGALAFIVLLLRRAPAGAKRLGVELGLIGGGAIGNLIDRAYYGRVTDFIVWRVGTHEWPTFNIADATLVVGVVAMVLFDFKQEPEKPPQANDKANPATTE